MRETGKAWELHLHVKARVGKAPNFAVIRSLRSRQLFNGPGLSSILTAVELPMHYMTLSTGFEPVLQP